MKLFPLKVAKRRNLSAKRRVIIQEKIIENKDNE
jgi:hypothetical protein